MIRLVASQMTLATRTAVVVSLLFIATCGVLGYRALLVFESQYIELVGNKEATLLNEYAAKLTGNMAAAQTTLGAASKLMEPKLFVDPVSARRFLEGRTFLRSSFPEGLYLINLQGQSVASVVGGPANSPREVLPQERELALHTIATGRPQLSAAFSPSAQSKRTSLSMSAPVFGAEGQVLGAILGSFTLLDKNYAGTFAARTVGQTGYLYMTTRDRTMLMHPQPERLLAVAAKPGQNIALDQALDKGFRGSMETVNSKGLHALVTFVAVPSTDWVLASNFPMAEVRAPFRKSLREMAGGTAIAVALLFVLVLVSVRVLMRPIGQLTQRLTDLGKGKPRPLDFPLGGELGVMANAFNQMIQALSASEQSRNEKERDVRELNATLEQRVQERTLALEHTNSELQQTLEHNISMRDELVQTKKQAALGRMVAGIAHELNTPIGNALLAATSLNSSTKEFGEKARTGLVKRSELDAFENNCLGATELVERNLTRVANLVSTFKQLASDQSSEHRKIFDLGGTIQEVLATLEPLKANRPLRLFADLPKGIILNSYPGAVGQLISIFFENALAHAFAPDVTGEISVLCYLDGHDRACIVVKDNGRGIASDYVEKVFDPFFASQMGVGGIGLGLTIAHHLVTDILGGTVCLESALGHGATFMAYLPLNAGQRISSFALTP